MDFSRDVKSSVLLLIKSVLERHGFALSSIVERHGFSRDISVPYSLANL